MASVQEIEEAIKQLSHEELAAFRSWFDEFSASAWDQQIERDTASGKLDFLIEEGLTDLHQGRCTDR